VAARIVVIGSMRADQAGLPDADEQLFVENFAAHANMKLSTNTVCVFRKLLRLIHPSFEGPVSSSRCMKQREFGQMERLSVASLTKKEVRRERSRKIGPL
jgi:hypothetical protein